ncbi:DUF3515 domain-containing protein [Streptomyces sp. NPDC007088]|uniref:DUF3515 domain-containing protein n=1 Tax=Streptomyces sp. NPDC007088 TaxID=3364773 RepID=UPI0036A64DA0
MNISVLRRLTGPAVLVSLCAAVGCSSTNGTAKAAVPSPGTAATALCRKLDDQLPDKVNGLSRNDPEPQSELTAGWGDPAIILRCGVPRPAEMNDPDADGAEVDGVGWNVFEKGDGSYRVTTVLRAAYVEVSIPKSRVKDGLAPLTDLAGPISRTIPKGIAD